MSSETTTSAVRSTATAALRIAWPALAVLAFQMVAFPVPLEVSLQGVVLGLLNAMVVLGLILVYRANRVVNLAQASMGTLPAALAGGVVLFSGLNWFAGLGVGLTTAIVAGILVDVIVIRRLRHSPRLVVTVATIGLAQVFAILGLLAPRIWGHIALVDPNGDRTGFEVPGNWSLTIGSTIFGSAELVAVLVSLVCIGLVSAALRFSDVGMAVRAAADSGDRALMLGVPVPRLEAGVWVVASVLAFAATYLQAGILGLELTAGMGLRIMVAALGAMTLGGFVSTPSMLFAAVSIGVLTQATGPAGGHGLTVTDAILAAVVVIGLLVRRTSTRRSDRDTTSSWQLAAEPRAVPFELARRPWLRGLRVGGVVAIVGAAAAVPLVLSEADVLRASTLVALVLVTASVVVLTGWTGEVTLGQMSFAATGAAVAAATTQEWRFDFSLALLAAGGAAALVAVVVALPSLRWQGIFLAVTTLAFALAATNYLLNPTVAEWIPTEDVVRRPLFGTWDLSSRTAMYELALGVTVVCFLGIAGVRRSRVGRVLRAVRDNPQSAQSFGVRVPLARLCAFGLSGFLAGVAGALLFYVHERYEVALFGATESLNVFISAVVGGVGSVLGAVLGAMLLDGGRGFLSGPAGLLPSAIGVLGVLLLLPGGLAELAYRLRDRFLRAYAGRRGIHVPSLVADSLDPDTKVPTRVSGATPTADAPGWLSVRGLDVCYDKVQVLFGVDVDFPRGQITALLGTNGAGKSTLLKAIGGVAPVTAGSMRLGHIDLGGLRPEQIPRQGIVQMPGGHGVFPSLTVDENLRVAAWLFRRQRADAERRIDDARARFPILEARRNAAAADLSGGQQQQLALAMALLARPDLLLVDELSLGLAPVLVQALLTELRRLRDEGTTVVVVEQSVNVALDIADRVYFMEKGEIRYSGDAQHLLEQPDLVRSVYLQGARDALAAPAAQRPPAAFDHSRPVLETAGLHVAFGGIVAVNYVDLAVARGEIVGLIGPNGAGKTTLFDLISGFTPADGGRVLLHGHDVSGSPPSVRARRGIGRSFQDARLFPGLTVAETIAVALERWIEGDDIVAGAFRLPASRQAARHVAARVDELVEMFGLQAFRSKRIGELSTGSRRMVDLACVVAHGPSVVMLDEPSSGIAQREAEALGPVLLGLRDRLDATLLVIEHDIALISSVADRLVALDQGTVMSSGHPAEVLDHPDVVASYLGNGGEALRRSDHTHMEATK